MEVSGRVQGGVVVLQNGVSLPEGAFVAVVYPSPSSVVSSTWSDALNDRRIGLIDKEIQQAISAEERIELAELQRKAVAFRDQMAPLPLEGARRLHKQLLQKKRQQDGNA